MIREAPPEPPVHIERKIVTIKGNSSLDAPPRKVIIERLAPFPPKSQEIIIERWLPYVEVKRKVIFQPAPPDPVVIKPRNVIVQWETPG